MKDIFQKYKFLFLGYLETCLKMGNCYLINNVEIANQTKKSPHIIHNKIIINVYEINIQINYEQEMETGMLVLCNKLLYY